jgi:hypothetical protein
VKVAQKLLGAPTNGGGRAVVEGIKEGKKASSQPNYTKTTMKIGSFPHFVAYNSSNTLFFAQKYLISYTLKMFFEEFINF